MEAAAAELRGREAAIFRLLDRISKALSAQDSLPDRARFAALQEELRFKQQQLGASLSTAQRLGGEMDARSGELARAKNAAAEVEAKLAAKRAQVAGMKADMVRFADVDGFRADREAMQARLEAERAALRRSVVGLRAAVEARSGLLASKAAQLGKDATHRAMEEGVARLRRVEGDIYLCLDYIRGKEGEADTAPLVTNMLATAAAINKATIASLSNAA